MLERTSRLGSPLARRAARALPIAPVNTDAILIDETRFPIVVVEFFGTPTDRQFGEYLTGMTQVLDRASPYALIMDATRSTSTPAKQRSLQAEWMKANHAKLERYSVGTAFVMTSPVVRGMLTAILWLQPLAAPHTVVATRREADVWVREQLRRAGVVVP
jgi:hypothetical protein